MNSLVDKAWKFHQATAGFPVETIWRTMAWLEDRYRRTRCRKVAIAIAVHYLILAIRHEEGVESEVAQEYCAYALHWHGLAQEIKSSAALAGIRRDH